MRAEKRADSGTQTLTLSAGIKLIVSQSGEANSLEDSLVSPKLASQSRREPRGVKSSPDRSFTFVVSHRPPDTLIALRSVDCRRKVIDETRSE